MQIQADVGAGQLLRPARAINRPAGSLDNVGNGAVDLYNVPQLNCLFQENEHSVWEGEF